MTVQRVTREGRDDTIPQVGRLETCERCGARDHEAVYSHEGRYGEGPIYAVVCTGGPEAEADWLTDYYTLEVVVIPA